MVFRYFGALRDSIMLDLFVCWVIVVFFRGGALDDTLMSASATLMSQSDRRTSCESRDAWTLRYTHCLW